MTTLQRSMRNSREALRRWAFAWMALVALFLTGAAVFASEPVLSYQMDGTHQGSSLKVFADGSMEHTEWTCCPHIERDVPEKSLGEGDVARLRDLGKRATQGVERTRELVSRVGLLTRGALFVWPSDSAPETVVYTLQPKRFEEWIYFETERLSDATNDLFQWLRNYVQVLPGR